MDLPPAGPHQGYNLPCRPHKRLAVADEADLAAWVDLLDHGTSLSIEEHPIAEGLIAFMPPKDDDGVGVDLRKDGSVPQLEVVDIDVLPCLSPHP